MSFLDKIKRAFLGPTKKPFLSYRRRKGDVWIGEWAHDMQDARAEAARRRRQGYETRITMRVYSDPRT